MFVVFRKNSIPMSGNISSLNIKYRKDMMKSGAEKKEEKTQCPGGSGTESFCSAVAKLLS